MDALRNIVGNVPHWSKRLDELSGQIEQRQIELAKFAECHPPIADAAEPSAATRSLRNKGSTESLKPRDEPAAHPVDIATPEPIPEATTPVPSPPLFTAIGTETTTTTIVAPPEEHLSTAPADTAAPVRPTSSDAAPADQSPYAAPRSPPSALQIQQTKQVIAAAQAKARATVRKRNRSDSIVSAEGVLPKYRSRTMVLVYYDSYVQSFFEELVKFISASRNLMRKAKMAAKVAQIKRMAELEMPDNDADEDDSGNSSELRPDEKATAATAPEPPTTPMAADAPLEAADPPTGVEDAAKEEEQPEAMMTPLNYVSTRRMHAYGRAGVGGPGVMMRPTYGRAAARAMYGIGGAGGAPGAGGLTSQPQKPDAFDELDKALEHAQSMCEHAAHQFLRDGDCDEEIANIKKRLTETNELAGVELDRMLKDPAALAAEPPKSRSYRVQSMRRDPNAVKEAALAAAAAHAAAVARSPPASPSPPAMGTAATAPILEADSKLEVDEGVEDVEWESMPKLVYKSTRMMGRGVR